MPTKKSTMVFNDHNRRSAALARARKTAVNRDGDDLLAPSTLPPWLRGDTSTLPKAPPSKARKGEK